MIKPKSVRGGASGWLVGVNISRIWVGGGVCGDCRCKLTAPLMVVLIILAVYGIYGYSLCPRWWMWMSGVLLRS